MALQTEKALSIARNPEPRRASTGGEIQSFGDQRFSDKPQAETR